MKAWWAGREIRTKVLIFVAIVALVAFADLTYSPPKAKAPSASVAATRPAPAQAKTPVLHCNPGTHLTKLGWCLANGASSSIPITAADRAAGAIQTDITACGGDAGCLVARPLKRKLIASGVAVQSMTCINDVGTHLKCLASLKDGSSTPYDVTANASTGEFIYQASP